MDAHPPLGPTPPLQMHPKSSSFERLASAARDLVKGSGDAGALGQLAPLLQRGPVCTLAWHAHLGAQWPQKLRWWHMRTTAAILVRRATSCVANDNQQCFACACASHAGEVLSAIVKEVQTLVDVSQHPNIIRFIGACVRAWGSHPTKTYTALAGSPAMP